MARLRQGDRLMRVGDTVSMRLQGVPMGHAISEPATLADSGSWTDRIPFDTSWWRVLSLPEPPGPWKFEEAFGVAQYVDDFLAFSLLYCPECCMRMLQLYGSTVGELLDPDFRFATVERHDIPVPLIDHIENFTADAGGEVYWPGRSTAPQ